MLRISKMADYATNIMAYLAGKQGQTASASKIAKATQIGLPTVSNVLKKLSPLVVSQRGTHGGYQLAIQPDKVSVAAIINKIEGPIAITECSHHHNHCDKTTVCYTRKNWQIINRTINKVLEQLTLADLQTDLNEHPIMLSGIHIKQEQNHEQK